MTTSEMFKDIDRRRAEGRYFSNATQMNEGRMICARKNFTYIPLARHRFADNADAVEYVAARAEEGSEYHQLAIRAHCLSVLTRS